jgi:hypothetical protein
MKRLGEARFSIWKLCVTARPFSIGVGYGGYFGIPVVSQRSYVITGKRLTWPSFTSITALFEANHALWIAAKNSS